jgi:hypothetical protein
MRQGSKNARGFACRTFRNFVAVRLKGEICNQEIGPPRRAELSTSSGDSSRRNNVGSPPGCETQAKRPWPAELTANDSAGGNQPDPRRIAIRLLPDVPRFLLFIHAAFAGLRAGCFA